MRGTIEIIEIPIYNLRTKKLSGHSHYNLPEHQYRIVVIIICRYGDRMLNAQTELKTPRTCNTCVAYCRIGTRYIFVTSFKITSHLDRSLDGLINGQVMTSDFNCPHIVIIIVLFNYLLQLPDPCTRQYVNHSSNARIYLIEHRIGHCVRYSTNIVGFFPHDF